MSFTETLEKLFKQKNIVRVAVVNNRGMYRVNFSFSNGNYITAATRIQVSPDSPSSIYGYEGWTAEDAYQHRVQQKRGYSIPLRETVRIENDAQAQQAIDDTLKSHAERGETWDDVEVKWVTYEESRKPSFRHWFSRRY